MCRPYEIYDQKTWKGSFSYGRANIMKVYTLVALLCKRIMRTPISARVE